MLIRPIPVYLLILTPLVFAPLLLIFWILLRPVVRQTAELYLVVVILILVLAPNPRAVKSDRPFYELVRYFQHAQVKNQPLRLFGNTANTVCPYLAYEGLSCIGNFWNDRDRFMRVDDFLGEVQYDYFIFDPSMKYLLRMDSGVREIVREQDHQWKLVEELGEFKIFEFYGKETIEGLGVQ